MPGIPSYQPNWKIDIAAHIKEMKQRIMYLVVPEPLAKAAHDQEQLGPNCIDCEHGARCRGGCSIMSYAATGGFHNDPYCFRRLRSVSLSTAHAQRFGAAG